MHLAKYLQYNKFLINESMYYFTKNSRFKSNNKMTLGLEAHDYTQEAEGEVHLSLWVQE